MVINFISLKCLIYSQYLFARNFTLALFCIDTNAKSSLEKDPGELLSKYFYIIEFRAQNFKS